VIAVDTNVVVRLLTDDEPRQTARARKLFDTQIVFVSRTVLLEAEWVLRRLYRLHHGAVIDALGALVSLANVRCEDEPIVQKALSWSREGFDFADALHVAASGAAEAFATFDRGLIKAAASIEAGMPVKEPSGRGD
jgi:predicted nucleic-acid-binding protein